MELAKSAIKMKDFDKLASIIMRESNELHAYCMDTQPPILYLDDSSKRIIDEVNMINQEYGEKILAYTFDAGPNAFLFCRETHLAAVKARFQMDIIHRLIVAKPGKGPIIEQI
ncbi:diphosphomevalonate decarboxylase [Cichlidogyrus casuarinus]|uniref:Diphosphomevalonate decarboxylase n=1 Tax=Cichlidogyrus casuarinus TaxID=1844966 RepID=A0ABD2Q210_9PLAT